MGDIGFGVVVLGLAVMAFAAIRDDKDYALTTYWVGAAITTAASIVIGARQGLEGVIGGLLLPACLILFFTYVRTPFLRVGNRTRTFFSAEPEPYSMKLSTPKTWWLLVFVAIAFMYPVLAFVVDGVRDRKLAAYIAGTVLVGMRFGYLDRLIYNRIAAGQYVQLALVSILTVGLFPVGYLAMYYGGRRLIAKTGGSGRHWRRPTGAAAPPPR